MKKEYKKPELVKHEPVKEVLGTSFFAGDTNCTSPTFNATPGACG